MVPYLLGKMRASAVGVTESGFRMREQVVYEVGLQLSAKAINAQAVRCGQTCCPKDVYIPFQGLSSLSTLSHTGHDFLQRHGIQSNA
jgi:hypothetical protein